MFVVRSVVTERRIDTHDTACVYYRCAPGAHSEHRYEMWRAMALSLGGILNCTIFRDYERQDPESPSFFS